MQGEAALPGSSLARFCALVPRLEAVLCPLLFLFFGGKPVRRSGRRIPLLLPSAPPCRAAGRGAQPRVLALVQKWLSTSGRDLSAPSALAGDERGRACCMCEPRGEEGSWRRLCHRRSCSQTQPPCWFCGRVCSEFILIFFLSLFFVFSSRSVVWCRGKQVHSLLSSRREQQTSGWLLEADAAVGLRAEAPLFHSHAAPET